jgi:hypothetical protein
LNLRLDPAGAGVTVRGAMALAEPIVFVTVTVYVVVDDGLTVLVPDAGTRPMPWSIVTVPALVVFQESVAGSPAAIVVGLTLAVTVGGGGITVSVVAAVVEPALLVAVML